MTRDLSYMAGHPVAAVLCAVLALVIASFTWRLLHRLAAGARAGLRRHQAEDLLTVIAALLAQAVVMNGMWRFAGHVLHFSGAERVSMFSFLEIAVVTCAFRARRNMKQFNTAGVEGIAVWALSAMSGVFAALDASSLVEAAFRLSAPLVAAWLWHRAMQLERQERTGRSTHWRLTSERLLIWLRLAEPGERAASEVDAHRRITRLAQAAKRVRELRTRRAPDWRVRLAVRRLESALEAAIEHAQLATDPERQEQMMAQIGALNAAESLASLDAAAPWQDARVPPAAELRREIAETVAEQLALEAARLADPAAARHIEASLGILRGLPVPPVPVLPSPRPEPAAPVPEVPVSRVAVLDKLAVPPVPRPEPEPKPAASRGRQPAEPKPGSRGAQAAAGPQPGDPPVDVIRAAVSAEQLAADTGISRWRAQQLRRPGSYALKAQLRSVGNGKGSA